MKKQLEITLEQAKELLTTTPSLSEVIYNSFPELKPKPIVPDRWEDLDKIEGYYINGDDSIINQTNGFNCQAYKDVHKTEKQALSSLAYAQLTQLMAATGDCDVDWSCDSKIKFCIARGKDKIKELDTYTVFQFLAFNTKSVRDEFCRKHAGLIKQFFQL